MAAHWAYDGTDPTYLMGSHNNKQRTHLRYSRYPEFYMPMCAKCHRALDGETVIAELGEYRSLLALVGTPDAADYIRRVVEESLRNEKLSR